MNSYEILNSIWSALIFPEFDPDTMADELKKQLGALTKLKYNAMMGSLFANNVITNQERCVIDAKIGEEKVMYLIVDIIIPSLRGGFCGKFKGFLQAMKESDDNDLKRMAERLGM